MTHCVVNRSTTSVKYHITYMIWVSYICIWEETLSLWNALYWLKTRNTHCYLFTSDASLSVLHFLLSAFHQFDTFLDFGKELRLTSVSAPINSKIPNYYSDILINSYLGQRTTPIGFAENKFFEQMKVMIYCETLHSKSSYNNTLIVIKLAEICSEKEVKNCLGVIFSLGNDDAVKALFVNPLSFANPQFFRESVFFCESTIFRDFVFYHWIKCCCFHCEWIYMSVIADMSHFAHKVMMTLRWRNSWILM